MRQLAEHQSEHTLLNRVVANHGGGVINIWQREDSSCVGPWLVCLSSFDALFLHLFSQVAEAKSKAEEAKVKAQAALDKATATKNKVERSNNDLRDLIKQIKDFLTREFDSLLGLHTDQVQHYDH